MKNHTMRMGKTLYDALHLQLWYFNSDFLVVILDSIAIMLVNQNYSCLLTTY